jgi:hypothetical protein
MVPPGGRAGEWTWTMINVDPYFSAKEQPKSTALIESLDPSNATRIFPQPGPSSPGMVILEAWFAI